VQVIDTAKRMLSAKDPDALTSVNSLSSTYRNEGRWTEAKGLVTSDEDLRGIWTKTSKDAELFCFHTGRSALKIGRF
jgi:hypothetical protein